jgi:hypothetical protein
MYRTATQPPRPAPGASSFTGITRYVADSVNAVGGPVRGARSTIVTHNESE